MGIVDKAMDKVLGLIVDDFKEGLSKSRVDFYTHLIHINTLIKSSGYLKKDVIHAPTTTTIYLYIVKDNTKKAG